MTFIESVAHYCAGLHVAVGCLGIECKYAEGDEEHRCEPSFAWTQCDSCGSTLGGDREKAYAWHIGEDLAGKGAEELVELSVCMDCVVYHANGDIPEEEE